MKDEPDQRFLIVVLDALRHEAGADRLHGLVTVSAADGVSQLVEIDLPIASGAEQVAAPAVVSNGRWMQIFLLALLGGLILIGIGIKILVEHLMGG